MVGDTYTIVDMDVWGWARLIPTVLGEEFWEENSQPERLVDEISARPAAVRAAALKETHKFKTEMDDEAGAPCSRRTRGLPADLAPATRTPHAAPLPDKGKGSPRRRTGRTRGHCGQWYSVPSNSTNALRNWAVPLRLTMTTAPCPVSG